MHVPVLEREVGPLPEPIVAFVLRYEFLWSVQSFCGARLTVLFGWSFRSRRDASVRPPRPPDRLLRGLILLPRYKVIFPLLIASQGHIRRHIVHYGAQSDLINPLLSYFSYSLRLIKL